MAIDSLGSSAAGAARPLDGLDGLDALGTLEGGIGQIDQTDRINLRRALRHLRKISGLAAHALEEVFGKGTPREASAGYIPRSTDAGPHMQSCRQTYPVQGDLSRRAVTGKKFAYYAPGYEITGRKSGETYAGSFARPVKLEEGGYLYRGKTYTDRRALESAIVRGRTGGAGSSPYTLLGRGVSPLQRGIPGTTSLFDSTGPSSSDLLAAIFNRPEGLSGGIPAGTPVPGGAGATPSGILSTNLPLENKVLLLGANLSGSLDREIEAKMKQIEAAMAGGSTGNAQNGPAHGGLAGGGSPGVEGSSTTGTGGAGSTTSQQSPNLQLLQTQLQQLMQERTQMFQMMQNIMKTLHDTSMAAIRNIKA